jgi:hypothetical protein
MFIASNIGNLQYYLRAFLHNFFYVRIGSPNATRSQRTTSHTGNQGRYGRHYRR